MGQTNTNVDCDCSRMWSRAGLERDQRAPAPHSGAVRGAGIRHVYLEIVLF